MTQINKMNEWGKEEKLHYKEFENFGAMSKTWSLKLIMNLKEVPKKEEEEEVAMHMNKIKRKTITTRLWR